VEVAPLLPLLLALLLPTPPAPELLAALLLEPDALAPAPAAVTFC